MNAHAPSPPSSLAAEWTADRLQEEWRTLNVRYFAGQLPEISIVWSRRLTSSAGLFVSRRGPRPRLHGGGPPAHAMREIRLSAPLLTRLAARSPFAEHELRNTLAHEMVHQWQFDVLKRRPNHGPDFLRKMTEMNRSGLVSVTIYHGLTHEVQALSRFAWRCTGCGRIYRRQRDSLDPTRHLCGRCRGPLQVLPMRQPTPQEPPAPTRPALPNRPPVLGQLPLPWCEERDV